MNGFAIAVPEKKNMMISSIFILSANACRNGGETAQRFCRPAPKGRIAGSCSVLS
jgi:hypothetical protein